MYKNYYPEPNPFYRDIKWKKTAKAILVRDGYQDQWLKRYSPIPRQADMVHHILPLSFYPEYAYEPWNLISLSLKTHNRMHDRYTGLLSNEGMKLARMTCRKRFKDPEAILNRMPH